MELVSEPAVLTGAAAAGARGRVLTFLTRGRGAVKVFARRLTRRGAPAPCLEPLQGGDLTCLLPPGGAAGRLGAFVPQRVWPGIRGDFERTVQALSFVEALGLCATEGEPQPELFALLVGLLNRMEGEDRPEVARVLATARLLRIAGFAPLLGACLVCREVIPEAAAVAVDVSGGGAVCRRCQGSGTGRTRSPQLSPGARRFLERSFEAESEQLLWRLRPSPGVLGESREILEMLLEASVGARLRSHDFLEKMRRSGLPRAPARRG